MEIFRIVRFKYRQILHILRKMSNITLAIPEDVKKEMEKFPEMNWSVIAREAIKNRINMLKKFKEFTKNSEFTEEEAINLGRRLKKGRFKELKSKGLV